MERIQPAGVHDPKAYAQGIRTGNLVFLSGQVALDASGELVGRGDVAAQADFIWKQIGVLLEAAGTSYRNIVKVTTYVTDMSARPLLMGIRDRYLGEHRVTSTLVGISALARPEFLIEIEATAVIE
jgi:2-iminobutanoate/2-iminopropanoate deaminase